MSTHQSLALGQKRFQAWQGFALFIGVLGELFLAGDWYGFAAVMPFVSRSLTLSPLQSGFIQGVFGITFAVGMVVWSPLSQRVSARALFAVGLIGAGIGMMAQASASSYVNLIVFRLVIGFFEAAVWIGTMKLIVSWFPTNRHGFTMGVLLASFSLAITLDFAIGIPLAAAYGWRTFFTMLGIATCAIGAIGGLTIRNTPRGMELFGSGFAKEKESSPGLNAPSAWTVFRSKWIYVASLAIFGDMFAISSITTWAVPAFIETQQMPVASAATIGSIMGFAQVFVLLVAGWLSDRVPRTLMLKVGKVCCFLVALSFIATSLFHAEWAALLAVAALSGFVVTSGGAIFSLLSEKYGEELAAAAIGFAEVGGILSTFVAPALLGAVITATHSFAAAFGVLAVVEIVILAVLLVIAN
ncbi:TPA: MFS transporter [Burkholderia cenocepacia]|nr:MFS transporter [Burkholderia cenocepacia]